MQLEAKLFSALKQAFLTLYHLNIEGEISPIQVTRKEFQGNFSIPLFPYFKRCKEEPMHLAEKIGEWMQKHTDLVASYNVISGFLNLVIRDSIWLAILKAIKGDLTYGCLARKNSKVVIEFSCPNTNKPQHLGHLRNNFLGSALAAILEAAGYSVVKVNLINDRGIHICKSMVAYAQFGEGETPESSGIKGDHLVGKYYVKFEQLYKEQCATPLPPIVQTAQKMLLAWEKGDPAVIALWKKMNGWVYEGFKETYERLGITFDRVYYESDTYLLGKAVVEEGLARKIFYRKEEGAIAVDLATYGLGEKVLLRNDGTAIYITQDLGTADLRYTDYHFDKMIYVVGDEQAYHFKVLFAIMETLGRPYAAAMYHLSYGMVNLPDGKMKSREGTVVDADQLVAEMVQTVKSYTEDAQKIEGLNAQALQQLYDVLAIGALKFFLLRVAPAKKIIFNPSESIDFQGDTATFIQYTYARICSLMRKAQAMGQAAAIDGNLSLNPLEQSIILQLALFPSQVEAAAQSYMPSIIANYVLELAKIYNKFYASYPILRVTDASLSSFRLFLSSCVAQVLQKSMELLTITLPEKM
ncbi:arginine--tRNA ligase [Candidatus Cardinium hertigii]|uniref:Arginine--tRNA ligase n=1 Tax=Candidatus Cardinium hertigii TaxID=247481 RepID=A0A2Z3L7G0_9BACT|nr:arginine--tRNA ligase [Candidatus Cardinium hertigii]AWN81573.1 Arginine--tRNA ligase [Candidatus Cardinium hertigii]